MLADVIFSLLCLAEMGTTLFWKSWEFSDLFFKIFLQYQNALNYDKTRNTLVAQRNQDKLYPSYIYFVTNSLLISCYVDVILEATYFNTMKIPMNLLTVYCIVLPLFLSTVPLHIAVWPFEDFCEFLNRLLSYNANLCPNQYRKTKTNKKCSTLELLTKGNRFRDSFSPFYNDHINVSHAKDISNFQNVPGSPKENLRTSLDYLLLGLLYQ